MLLSLTYWGIARSHAAELLDHLVVVYYQMVMYCLVIGLPGLYLTLPSSYTILQRSEKGLNHAVMLHQSLMVLHQGVVMLEAGLIMVFDRLIIVSLPNVLRGRGLKVLKVFSRFSHSFLSIFFLKKKQAFFDLCSSVHFKLYNTTSAR